MNLTQPTVQFLAFDTEIFGIQCGRIEIHDEYLSEIDINNILKEASDLNIKHLVVKVPSEWVKVCNILESLKFKIKVCSLLLEKKTTQSINIIDDIFLYEGTDDNRVIDITVNAFSSGTRFHFEEQFSPGRIKLLYEKWIDNLMNNPKTHILVHKEDSIITGYIAVEFKEQPGNIGHVALFAVDNKYRHKGIGNKLLSAVNSCITDKTDSLSVITESINYSALKLYIDNGFSIRKSWHVFHLNV